MLSNVIPFPVEDVIYITGDKDKGEPDIVGVQCKNISIQLSVDNHNILLGDVEIKREELIAFILGTGICWDLGMKFKEDTWHNACGLTSLNLVIKKAAQSKRLIINSIKS